MLRGSSGFSLLELLVVLTIASLMITLVPPAISAVVPRVALRSATHDLAQTLRQARGRAIYSNRAVDVVLRFEPPSYALADAPRTGFPNGVRMTISQPTALDPADADALDASDADGFRLRFFPDGSSTGAAITLMRGPVGYRIGVGWLASNLEITAVSHGR